MREYILKSLRGRRDVKDWSVRHVSTFERQLYIVSKKTEAKRCVKHEHYTVDVLRQFHTDNGEEFCGSGNATLLAGDDIEAAVDTATLMAGLVRSPPHGIPEPGEIPDVSLVDEQLQDHPMAVLEELHERLQLEVNPYAPVRLTSAEFFAEERSTHLSNSRGIEVEQTETNLNLIAVLAIERNGSRVETSMEISRRRLTDLDLKSQVAHHARYLVDFLHAGRPEDYSGAVVLRGEVLALFMNTDLLKVHSSGKSRFNSESAWEVGHPVIPGEVKGDPLTLWANRLLPYGTESNRFDDEGIPAQRVLLIHDNKLINYTANQQYAEYLNIPATGAFGCIEIPPGGTPAKDLLSEPYLEVVAFSWFNPNVLSGDFACEVRQGYRVEGGRRNAFRGGMLVGNVLKALSNVQWSSEVGFYGNYQGPTTARFEDVALTSGTNMEA